ncbi:MAG: trypsin-like serine protease [Rhodobacteraceae bacterium]|nr:trypsin-like serine protease [Paracoccaceae bacterium]
MRALFGLVIGLGVAATAAAQDKLRTLETLDESRAWAAVGRLDLDGKGFCTGSLVAPDLVLTAAHCLYDKDTSEPIPAQKIQFRAGWRNGSAMAFRDVRRVVQHPKYEYDEALAAMRVANDVAFLQLQRPIRSGGVRPFRTGTAASRGEIVGIVSYAAGRSEAPSLQELCKVMEQSREVLVLSCEVDFGASGAPVFRFDADGPRIVSVISAKAELDGERVSVGAPLERNLDVLWETVMAEDSQRFTPPPGVKSISVTRSGMLERGTARQVGGAKFVKP